MKVKLILTLVNIFCVFMLIDQCSNNCNLIYCGNLLDHMMCVALASPLNI